MNIEDTLRLIDAGFTSDEIRAMATQEAKGPEDKGTGSESGAEDKEHESKVDPQDSEEVQRLTAEITKLTDTVKALQESNIKNAGAGSGDVKITDPVSEQIDSFLKQL